MVLFNFSSRVPAIRNESPGDTPLHQFELNLTLGPSDPSIKQCNEM